MSRYHRIQRIIVAAAILSMLLLAVGPARAQKPILRVYNWTTYIADNTIADFAATFNVEVQYDTYTDMSEMFAKLQTGGAAYDVIVPSYDYVPILVESGLLAELDFSKIPNFANIAENFKDPSYDPGNKYSIPYQWGTIGIGYSAPNLGKDITSIAEMFDPAYVGRISILESQRETMSMFLNYLGKDPNSTNPEDLEALKQFFIEKKDWIASFNEADAQFAIAKGDIYAATLWSGDMLQVIADPGNADLGLHYVIPSEGGLLWTDNLSIPANAPEVDLAHAFINYLLDPQVGADISNYTQYGSPNQASIDQGLIDQELLENPAIYPPADVLDNCFTLTTLDEASQIMYDDVWAAIKAAVSE